MLDASAKARTHRETRIEDEALLRGAGRYTADTKPDDAAYGVFVRSPHAFARIRGIDTQSASAAPGVLCVLTATDMDAAGIGGITRQAPAAGRNGTKLNPPERPPLARDRVVHVGQTVALVVAESAVAAQDAAERVAVDYEELEPVLDLRTAGDPGARQIWPDIPNNLAFDWPGFESNTEDNLRAVEGAMAQAAHVVRMSIVNQRLSCASMEPRGATARYDSVSGYTVHAGSQGAGALQGNLAAVIGTSDKVRVLSEDVGGAFGLKTLAYPEYLAIMLAAKRTGRTVHWMATRSESFTSDNEARDMIADCELALDARGKFLALRMRVLSNSGAFLAPPSVMLQCNTMPRCLPGMYHIPLIDVQTRCYHTNTMAVGAYRGAGRPEANYILERLVDEAALQTGIDRVSLRRRNLIKSSQIPYKSAAGNVYDSGDFEAVVDHALTLADYAGYRQRKRESAKRGKRRGIGVACVLEHSGATPLETASLTFPGDGTLTVGLGVHPNGQGHATVFTRLAMDRLGYGRDRIKLRQGDSALDLAGNASVGSRAAMTAGSALSVAIDVMLEKGGKIAAQMLEAAEADIEFKDGEFRIAGTDRRVSLFDVAAEADAMKARGQIAECLDTKEKVTIPLTFPNGCHVVEVEVDPQTGETQIAAYTAVADSGVVLNPVIVEGQIQGGVVQGLGQVLLEKTVYDTSGQILTASFMDYAMPRAHHAPPITVADHPVPATTNPLGVKGVGEAGTTGSLGAIMNAVIDALPRGAGTSLDMPATAEKVWRACRQAE